jgi:protein-S-isoprenylcysteine O-methyltransferase Ste14
MTNQANIDKATVIRAVFAFLGYLFLNPIILFTSAGTTRWGIAWVYFGISIAGTIASRVLARRKNPDLLEERARYQDSEGVKDWDKVLMPLAALYGPMVTMVVAGLDTRFEWTDVIPVSIQVIAIIIAALGYILGAWAMIENRFFSAVVRIQEDREHTVCDTGPYRYIRHPGYAGGILWFLMTPLILDSLWAYIPIGITITASVLRTAFEDKTLQAELQGYKDYALKTRYRLVPWVW